LEKFLKSEKILFEIKDYINNGHLIEDYCRTINKKLYQFVLRCKEEVSKIKEYNEFHNLCVKLETDQQVKFPWTHNEIKAAIELMNENISKSNSFD